MNHSPISHKKLTALERKISTLGLRECDFVETFMRACGAGGQNVNKVSTCVLVRHLPTGLECRCQRERSQALNRFLAKRDLVDKIEVQILGRASQKRHAIEKLRRQKRRRSRRAKEKMLADKHQQSIKKGFRKNPQSHSED